MLKLLIEVLFSFKYDRLIVEPTRTPKAKPDVNNLVFGREFSDHMLSIEWSSDRGWDQPRITPYQNLSLPPSSCTFHYALEVPIALLYYALSIYCISSDFFLFKCQTLRDHNVELLFGNWFDCHKEGSCAVLVYLPKDLLLIDLLLCIF